MQGTNSLGKLRMEEIEIPQIKEEFEDDIGEESGLETIKPTIENILSASSSSSEDDSEDDDEEDDDYAELQTTPQLPNDHNLPRNKKKREAFTLQQKLEVLKYLTSHSVNATSRFYKVDPKSIRLWRSQKAKIEQTVQDELKALEQTDGITPRKRISGAGRKKRGKHKVIVEIEENPNKRHRRSIKLSDKVEIIRLIEHGQTQSDVARSLGISQSTVQTIWSNKSDILERNMQPKKKRKNLHWKKYSVIDQALLSWTRQCRETNIIVDGKMLYDKAIELAEYFKQPGFKAQGQRWVEVFKRRHNLTDVDRQDRLQNMQLANQTLDPNQSSLQQLIQQTTPLGSQLQSNNDLIPDFDLSSLPSLLYPHEANQLGISHQTQIAPPNFNMHLPPVPINNGIVTTCDAMKYVDLIRHWVTTTMGGENEEMLNNHLNAIENAILKRRMTEMLTPSVPSRN